MKKSLLCLQTFLVMLIIASCGKSNKVNSGTVAEIKSTNTITSDFSHFVGNYDLIRMNSEDCGASIQLVRECNGLKLLSNHLGPEEFCNINKGRIKNTTVTLVSNVLKSEVVVSDRERMNFTNTLTFNDDGTLSKISNLKSRMSRCLYQKR